MKHVSDLGAALGGVFGQAIDAGAGFALHFDGVTSGPEFSSADWRVETLARGDSGLSDIVLSHVSGLRITRETRSVPGFAAVEYKLRLKNTGEETLPALTELQSLRLSFALDQVGDISVMSSGGGLADAYLPPRSFAISRRRFAPSVETGGFLHLTTEGGRSSNKDLPFFLLHSTTRSEGLFVAFGWSGQWEAFVARAPEKKLLNVWGKVPGLELALAPGEEITGPTVLVGAYAGSDVDGCNMLRRLIRTTITPSLGGAPVIAPATYNHWFNIEEWFDEPLLHRLADAAAEIEQEYFLLDAGWFEHPPREGGGFVGGAGNWARVNTSKFPNGLQPFAEYVRSKGLKFGLWFEPERVARKTLLAEAHPDWVLWEDGGDAEAPFVGWLRHLPKDHAYFRTKHGVLNYGRGDVQDWVVDLLDRYIREFDLRYIRYDCNIAPLPYWTAHDEPGRRGIAQLRHIEGLYTILDRIRAKHPETLLEGCASGGRRIDLETARRFHTFLISDQTSDPAIVRYHLHGANHFLPGNYHYVQYTLPMPVEAASFVHRDKGFQSMFAGAFGIGGRIDTWSQETRAMARKHVWAWKTIRRYLVDDFYPLSAQPGDLDAWSGWQFHDPNDHSGFIQTFQSSSDRRAITVRPFGFDSGRRYSFTDLYSDNSFEMLGVEINAAGIAITHEANAARVLTYRSCG